MRNRHCIISAPSLAEGWFDLLQMLYHEGDDIRPRGKLCREITGVRLCVENMQRNIIISSARDVNYRFAVAEWLWIVFGHNDVRTIAPYNKMIAAFSDNGLTFAGAYGPPMYEQLPVVLNILRDDPDSRQAVVQIYRQPHYPTKDVPCTLSLQFLIRHGLLDVIVTMRSSDIWLGIPYDAFTFSMIGNGLSALLGVSPGSLTFNLGSSHLYATDFEAMHAVQLPGSLDSPLLPSMPPVWLNSVLMNPNVEMECARVDPPWQMYCHVLQSKNRVEALRHLTETQHAANQG